MISNESEEDREAHLELINSLVTSRSTIKRNIGFFMIRNTTVTFMRERILVDEAFHPYLRTLYLDPELETHFRKPEQLVVFTSNLDPAFLATPVRHSPKSQRKKELREGKKERKRGTIG